MPLFLRDFSPLDKGSFKFDVRHLRCVITKLTSLPTTIASLILREDPGNRNRKH
jgi:hypothetical protein